jgi:hypothetical protein
VGGFFVLLQKNEFNKLLKNTLNIMAALKAICDEHGKKYE